MVVGAQVRHLTWSRYECASLGEVDPVSTRGERRQVTACDVGRGCWVPEAKPLPTKTPPPMPDVCRCPQALGIFLCCWM